MSQAVCSHQERSRRFTTKKYEAPVCQFSQHIHCLRHPNQPFASSPSASPPSSSSPYPISSSSSMDSENEIMNVNDSSEFSIDGEVDLRVDIIVPSSSPTLSPSPSHPPPHVVINITSLAASAPPLSDDECECKIQDQHEKTQNKEQQIQQEKKEEEEDVCIICYEEFEPDGAINGHGDGHDHHANYSPEELEEMEAKQKISNFCLTCKYHVHQMCLDEYRLCKVTDAMKNNPFLRHPNSMIPVGTFGIKCLICSRQVESIHISRSGDIDIVKTQVQGIFDLNSNREQQQMQVQIQEILHNRMQRRRRRRERIYCLKDKMCMICFCLLGVITILVLMFRMFL